MTHRSGLGLALGALSLFSSCSTFIPAMDRSEVVGNERVVVRLKHDKDAKVTAVENVSIEMTDVAVEGVAKLIELAVEAVGDELESEAKRYTGVYRGEESGAFWAPVEEGSKQFHPLGSVAVTRFARGGKQMEASFRIERLDAPNSRFFRFALESFRIRGSKAKVPSAPWWTQFPLLYGLFIEATNDGAIDVEFAFRVKTLAIGKDSKIVSPQSEPLFVRLTDVPVRLVEPDGKDHRFMIEDGDWNKLNVSKSPPLRSAWFVGPASGADTPVSVFVQVTESEDFGRYIDKGSRLLDENKSKIIDAGKDLATRGLGS